MVELLNVSGRHAGGHRAEHVPLRKDSDEAPEVLHDDSADVLRAHALRDLAERVLGGNRDEVRLDDVGERAHEGGSLTARRGFARPRQEITIGNDRDKEIR